MRYQINVASRPLRGILTCLFVLFIIYLYLTLGGYHIGWNLITGKSLTYYSEQYCYIFQYPGRWKLYTSGDEGWHGGARPYQRAMVLEPKPYILGQIQFMIDQVPMNQPDLDDVAAWSITYRSNNYQQIAGSPLEPFTVGGKPALIRTFSDTTTEVYIAREFDGLILRITSKESYHENALESFQTILETFKYESCAN